MISLFKKTAMLVLGGTAFAGVFAWDGQSASLVAPASARVGYPATPMSYAGVARRTTRRAVYAGAVVGAATRPVVVAAPTTVVIAAPTTQTCVDTGNPDGSITRTCR